MDLPFSITFYEPWSGVTRTQQFRLRAKAHYYWTINKEAGAVMLSPEP